MAVQIKWTPAGGSQTDITGVIDWRSIQETQVLTKEVSTLQFDILLTPATASSIPAVGDVVDRYEDQISGNVHVFGGTVTSSELKIDRGIQVRYTIIVTDWGYLLDSKMLTATYTSTDPGEIIKNIISTYAPSGFTTTNVQDAGFVIPSVKFNYQPISKCIQKIATLIGWDWYVDPAKDVHFFQGDVEGGAGSGAIAPFVLDDTSGNLEWPTIDLTTDTTNLKNSVYVIGSTYKKVYTAGTTPDSYTTQSGQTTYYLAFPYEKSTMTVKLGGASKTIGVYGTDSPGSYDLLYYSGGSGSQPFIVFSSNPGATTLVVYGTASVPILGYAGDGFSIAKYGEYQDAIVDKQITTYQEAQQRALAEVLQFGHPVNDLKFNTLKTGLFIGQSITINSTILGVNLTLVIKRVQGTGYSPTQLEYQVEAIGSDQVTFNDVLSVLLEQELNQNSVTDDTILQVLLRITEGLIITDAAAITTSTGPYKWGTMTWGFSTWS